MNSLKVKPDFAIIICTFNPEERIFTRTLKAAAALEVEEGIGIECIIADNNSDTPVVEMDCVKDFLKENNWAKVITEPTQGKTFAILAALKVTTAPNIIICDDDNELDVKYLKILRIYLDKYPFVSAWGPGKIAVEFIDPVSDWFAKNFKCNFFEKNQHYTQYGCVLEEWPLFFPYGLGLAVKRLILDRYNEAIKGGRLNSADKIGNVCTGGGDKQIIWEACKIGFAAGSIPELKLTHVISSKKSNLRYIKRSTFSSVSYGTVVFVESFPTEKEKLLKSIPSDVAVTCLIFRVILSHIIRLRCRRLSVDLSYYIGSIVGKLQATGSNKLRWVYFLVKLLGLD